VELSGAREALGFHALDPRDVAEVESARPLPPTGHRACVFNVLQAVRRIFCAGQSGAAGAYTVAALPLHDSAVNAPPPINLLPRTSPRS
jgi:hypothetical protein